MLPNKTWREVLMTNNDAMLSLCRTKKMVKVFVYLNLLDDAQRIVKTQKISFDAPDKCTTSEFIELVLEKCKLDGAHHKLQICRKFNKEFNDFEDCHVDELQIEDMQKYELSFISSNTAAADRPRPSEDARYRASTRDSDNEVPTSDLQCSAENAANQAKDESRSYRSNNHERKPITKQPSDQYYDDVDDHHSSKPATAAKDGRIRRQSLGRIAKLGDLYDVRSDSFCDINLFGATRLQKQFVSTEPVQSFQKVFVWSDDVQEKMSLFEMEGELMLSVVGGLVQPSGHGLYFSPGQKSNHEEHAALICKYVSQRDQLKIQHENVTGLISSSAVKDTPSATHVVVGIEWGVTMVVSVSSLVNNDDATAAQTLKDTLNVIEKRIELNDTMFSMAQSLPESVRLNIFSDSLSQSGGTPFTLANAIIHLQNTINGAKNDRGQKIAYILMPLSFFESLLPHCNLSSRVYHSTGTQILMQLFEKMRNIDAAAAQTNDILLHLKNHADFIDDGLIHSGDETVRMIKFDVLAIKERLSKTIVSVRWGNEPEIAIERILQEFDTIIQKAGCFINVDWAMIFSKVDYIIEILEYGVQYVGKGNTLQQSIRHSGVCYAFFCTWHNADEHFVAAKAQFEELYHNQEPCVFIDQDVAHGNSNYAGENRLCLFKDGVCINDDVLNQPMKKKLACFAKSTVKMSPKGTIPKDAADLEICCPNSLAGNCDAKKRLWRCGKCREVIQYDLKKNFCCECGSAPAASYEFLCKDDVHGLHYVAFEKTVLEKLLRDIKPMRDVNILILGETGVGKSTWINGFANYVTFSSLEEAKNAEPVYVIPSHFTITDDKMQSITIQVGKSENENFTSGQSATQNCLAHVIRARNMRIHLIDTPGIGDYEGAEQDKKNLAQTLRYLEGFDEIHGVCILLKPNDARVTVIFKYCINELLSYLHKDAARNIMICFTNVRGTLYRPGDSLPSLNTFLAKLKNEQGVDIPTNTETIYCLDNESFRFLCACHQNIPFSEAEHKQFEESWKKSEVETIRLLEHIEKLPPHQIRDTLSLNETRRIILTLAKPLADITSVIQTNITAIEDKKTELQNLDGREVDIADRLSIPQFVIESTPLGYPRTVCTASQCIETRTVGNSTQIQTLYITHCHDHCYLTGVVAESFPNPDLLQCEAMNGGENCTKCGCRWDVHMHITYDQEVVMEMVEDPTVQNILATTKDSKERIEKIIEACNSTIRQYEAEQNEITEICVRFGAFLKKYAILPYNDAFEDYVKHLITEEKRISEQTQDTAKLEKLQRMLLEYAESKKVLMETMSSTTSNLSLKPEDINKQLERLFALPKNGPGIRKLFDTAQNAQHQNFKFSENVFNPPKLLLSDELVDAMVRQPNRGHYAADDADVDAAEDLDDYVPKVGTVRRLYGTLWDLGKGYLMGPGESKNEVKKKGNAAKSQRLPHPSFLKNVNVRRSSSPQPQMPGHHGHFPPSYGYPQQMAGPIGQPYYAQQTYNPYQPSMPYANRYPPFYPSQAPQMSPQSMRRPMFAQATVNVRHNQPSRHQPTKTGHPKWA